MNKLLVFVGTAAVAFAVVPASASASPWNRSCGSARDGFLLSNNAYEVHGPWHIKMSESEAATLARREPVQEFGSRITTKQMPCLLAQSIAEAGGNSWTHWRGDDGWTNVKTYTSGGTTIVGTFHCTGYNLRGRNVARETCTWPKHAVVGSFTISKSP